MHARINSGELVFRVGAESPAVNLTMLEIGELDCVPVTQVLIKYNSLTKVLTLADLSIEFTNISNCRKELCSPRTSSEKMKSSNSEVSAQFSTIEVRSYSEVATHPRLG